jgi:hypothetical protein
MHVRTSNQPTLSLGFGGYTCNWGVHMCCLFETDEERDELVFGFLHQGDVDGDRLRFYHSAPNADGFRSEWARRFPSEASHPDDPARFTMLTSRARCFPEGRFEPLRQDPKLRALRDDARRDQTRVRGIGEMDWVVEGVPGTELLLPYEARLNALFDDAPLCMLCIYDLRKHSGATIMGVLRTHRFAITRGLVVENPYYDPDRVLAESGLDWPALA